VIDSDSRDGSPEMFRSAGFEVISIRRESFDHGGTRNYGMTLASGADILVYLTQDAIPRSPTTLEALLRRFTDPLVAITYGRQCPRDCASAIERHARLFNYPATSAFHTLSSVTTLGFKSIFNSNAFAGYRRTALEAVGGFSPHTIMGEDQIAAARLLLSGWAIAYASNAEVIHSHSYSFIEEFQRYFDIGVCHQENRVLLEHFRSPASDGRRFVMSELAYLIRHAGHRIPEASLRTALKLLGYHLGQTEQSLPRNLKVRLAMQKEYFALPPVVPTEKLTRPHASGLT
jgi:rhamnosyltransferase